MKFPDLDRPDERAAWVAELRDTAARYRRLHLPKAAERFDEAVRHLSPQPDSADRTTLF